MVFKNLCPHDIVVVDSKGTHVTFPASGTVARVATIPGAVSDLDIGGATIKVATATQYGAVENLPKPEEGTVYIVSQLVLDRCVGRKDVFVPGTGPQDGAIRYVDGPRKGQVEAVTRLIAAATE